MFLLENVFFSGGWLLVHGIGSSHYTVGFQIGTVNSSPFLCTCFPRVFAFRACTEEWRGMDCSYLESYTVGPVTRPRLKQIRQMAIDSFTNKGCHTSDTTHDLQAQSRPVSSHMTYRRVRPHQQHPRRPSPPRITACPFPFRRPSWSRASCGSFPSASCCVPAASAPFHS